MQKSSSRRYRLRRSEHRLFSFSGAKPPKAFRVGAGGTPYVPRLYRYSSSFDQKTINKTAQRSAYQWSDPINIMIVPKICCNGGTEHTRRIHGRAGKRSAEQNVQSDRCSDHQPGDAPGPAFINSCAVNDKHEQES